MVNNSLLVVNFNAVREIHHDLENRVHELIRNRHDYPIWPVHDEPLDFYEQEYHGQLRHVYYSTTITLIRFLRATRKVVGG